MFVTAFSSRAQWYYIIWLPLSGFLHWVWTHLMRLFLPPEQVYLPEMFVQLKLQSAFTPMSSATRIGCDFSFNGSHPTRRKAVFTPLNNFNTTAQHENRHGISFWCLHWEENMGSHLKFLVEIVWTELLCRGCEQWTGSLKSQEAWFIGFTAIFS